MARACGLHISLPSKRSPGSVWEETQIPLGLCQEVHPAHPDQTCGATCCGDPLRKREQLKATFKPVFIWMTFWRQKQKYTKKKKPTQKTQSGFFQTNNLKNIWFKLKESRKQKMFQREKEWSEAFTHQKHTAPAPFHAGCFYSLQ